MCRKRLWPEVWKVKSELGSLEVWTGVIRVNVSTLFISIGVKELSWRDVKIQLGERENARLDVKCDGKFVLLMFWVPCDASHCGCMLMKI
jgi:hypothetical protein